MIALIEAAEKYASSYDNDERELIKTDVLNAFYAGTKYRQAEIDALKAQIEELKVDAERYRSIKYGSNMRVVFGKYPDGINIHDHTNHLTWSALDKAVDQAIQQKGEE